MLLTELPVRWAWEVGAERAAGLAIHQEQATAAMVVYTVLAVEVEGRLRMDSTAGQEEMALLV
jgi:hypothetical protein